jgi:hypothetical protein
VADLRLSSSEAVLDRSGIAAKLDLSTNGG